MDAINKKTLQLSSEMFGNDILLSEVDVYSKMESIPKINELINRVQEKEKCESRKAAVEFLLSELQNFSNAAYHIFMDAMSKTGQNDIVEKIVQDIRPMAVHQVILEKRQKNGINKQG